MHLRASAAALATVLIASGAALVGGPTAAATDSTPGYSVKAITVDVLVGPKGDVPCRMDADLYVPDGTSRRRRAPAILTTNGFGGDKADGNQSAVGKGFVQQGYVVLSYSGLGFGKTTCKVQMDNPDWDGKAGKQMVDVLAGKRPYLQAGNSTKRRLRSIAMEKRGDPRVGMIGGSYGGQIQYAVAKQDRRIDAIIPIITWNDLAYSLAPNNVAKKHWIDLFFGAGIASGAENATADPETMVGCPNFVDQACVGVAAMNTVGYPDAGHPGAGEGGLGRELRQADQGAHPAGAGAEGHVVQPQRVRRDLRLAAQAGHHHQDDLAVLGPLRLEPGPR